jgi:stage II sporulation protein D
MPRARFREIVSDYYGFSADQKEIEMDISGRVKTVTLIDQTADTITFTGNEFRLFINQFTGPLALRSTNYDWQVEDDTLRFEGKGLGHGVGLCQWGALGFAETGWMYKDILSFYFSGTKIVNLNEMETDTITLFN